MKKIPKNEPKRLGKNIVFNIPEASAEERLLERSRLHRALAKGVRHIGSVPSYRHGNKLIIPIDALINCLFEQDEEGDR